MPSRSSIYRKGSRQQDDTDSDQPYRNFESSKSTRRKERGGSHGHALQASLIPDFRNMDLFRYEQKGNAIVTYKPSALRHPLARPKSVKSSEHHMYAKKGLLKALENPFQTHVQKPVPIGELNNDMASYGFSALQYKRLCSHPALVFIHRPPLCTVLAIEDRATPPTSLDPLTSIMIDGMQRRDKDDLNPPPNLYINIVAPDPSAVQAEVRPALSALKSLMIQLVSSETAPVCFEGQMPIHDNDDFYRARDKLICLLEGFFSTAEESIHIFVQGHGAKTCEDNEELKRVIKFLFEMGCGRYFEQPLVSVIFVQCNLAEILGDQVQDCVINATDYLRRFESEDKKKEEEEKAKNKNVSDSCYGSDENVQHCESGDTRTR